MKKVLSILFFMLPLFTWAQSAKLNVHHYPQHYFRVPLNIPVHLAGNFGECRPGHFHSGLDIKTNDRQNLPVYAAASGYISRIKTQSGGFGHAIYITHPNGYTTLYAHLNNFVPKLEQYLRTEQYKHERWDLDLQIPPGMFPVKKGQQIAWSGNTGASTAPHLHFEIRNTKTEHPLNPEMFGIPVTDNIPPKPTQIAVYDLNKSIYSQTPDILSIKKTGSIYKPVAKDTIVTNTSLAGIGVNVYDYMNGSHNTLAFNNAELYLDGKLQSRVRLDDIGYDETRYVYAYSDYKTRIEKHHTFQCFFQLPGNHLDRIYEDLNNEQGGLVINDEQTHKVTIRITDDQDNKSTIVFYIRYSGQPDPKSIGDNCTAIFKVNQPNNFSTADVMFTLDSKVLYDNLCFHYKKTSVYGSLSDHYMIDYPYVPAHRHFTLSIRPNEQLPTDLRSKVAMIYSDGKDEEGYAATYTDNGWYKSSVRNFGTFWLTIDTIPPTIHSLQKNHSNLSKVKQITFKVKDNITSIKEFKGMLDGKWVCFEQHRDLFFYYFDNHCSRGKHKLVFTATDENNNTQTVTLSFTR